MSQRIPSPQPSLRALATLPVFHPLGQPLQLEDQSIDSAIATTAQGGEVRARDRRFDSLPTGTHCVAAFDREGRELDEEFVTVGAHQGERPVHGFATSFTDDAAEEVLAWNVSLRATVVQLYDWMASYTEPLPEAEHWEDPSHRPVSRAAMKRLAGSLGDRGAVALAYAPIYAVGREYAARHPDQLLYDDEARAIRFLDQIILANPANTQWQAHFASAYGGALDALGMTGLHVDTYGYPRIARDASGAALDMARAYEEFLVALRRARPNDVISFNQVNGVPAAARLSSGPTFRYCEIWPPNDKWRHFEGLVDRSAGRSGHGGSALGSVRGSLACYPPVWGEKDQDDAARVGALATVLRTEAITTSLATSVLMFGDRQAVLKDPYYPKHERLNAEEARRVLSWRRMALRVRDLFIDSEDTTWYEIDDENGAVSVHADVPVRPEPEGGTLFARVTHAEGVVAISLVDLSASEDGSWRSRSGEGRVTSAVVRILLDQPDRWVVEAASVERDGGRFIELATNEEPHRQGRALRCEVPVNGAWCVVRARLTSAHAQNRRR